MQSQTADYGPRLVLDIDLCAHYTPVGEAILGLPSAVVPLDIRAAGSRTSLTPISLSLFPVPGRRFASLRHVHRRGCPSLSSFPRCRRTQKQVRGSFSSIARRSTVW